MGTQEEFANDFRFQKYGVAPKSAADFAFLLHGFHFLREDGTMAIILPHGVLFRGGVEKTNQNQATEGWKYRCSYRIANLSFPTGIPVCILVLKKCKKSDDVLFINASEGYKKDKRQNRLREGENGEPNDIQKIVETYQSVKKSLDIRNAYR